ncbi:MAG: hypothetical protein HWN51_03655 [Desulfobacterales bacterium]|nr:hypothetical protein [Desulfobacterales bacterium]
MTTRLTHPEAKEAAVEKEPTVKRLLLCPLLFAVFPTVSLLSSNLDQVLPSEVLPPIILSVCATAALLLVAAALLRSSEQAAVTVSAFWLFFFSFGHLTNLLGGPNTGRDRYLLLLWALLFAVCVLLVRKSQRHAHDIVRILCVAGVALMAIPAAKAAPRLARKRQANEGKRVKVVSATRPARQPEVC